MVKYPWLGSKCRWPSSYTIKTETIDGKQVKVLVSAGVPEIGYAVYYQSKDMAQQNADKKFDDLNK